MAYTKSISPKFETDGRRLRLVGQLAELHDGAMLLHSMVYDTPTEAKQALDRIVWDILHDLHERGLVDDVAAACEAEGVASHQIPSWLLDAQAAHAEDDAIVCAICGSPAWCACATSAVDDTPPGNDCPDHGPYADDDCPKCRARQNLAINRVIVRVHATLHIPCKLCGGDHLTQHCASIRVRLFAAALCPGCGDPLPSTDGGTCQACREWAEPVVVPDVEYAVFGFAA